MNNPIVTRVYNSQSSLNIARSSNYPPKYNIPTGGRISRRKVEKLADEQASKFRKILDIGTDPISDIFSITTQKLGIRLYQCRLSSSSNVSGLYAFDESVGATILLNLNHPRTRRVFTAAHALGHFVSSRETLDVEVSGKSELSKPVEERFANRFGSSFLMPESSFTSAFKNYTAGSGKLTWQSMFKLADQFQVSNQACVLRLEELELVPIGTWNWMEYKHEDRIKNRSTIMRTGGDNEDQLRELHPTIPYNICLMAHAAWKNLILSEGQLSGLLNLGRVELRKIIDEVELDEIDESTIH